MSIMNDPEQDIGQVLERLAQSQPAAPAIHAPGRTSLTYADLGAQIRYVRERLRAWKIVPGDVIAGVIPERPEMAVACATIPALATFAPLGPALAPAAYTELMTRLRPKALVVPRALDHPLRAIARQYGMAEIELLVDPSAPAGIFALELARPDGMGGHVGGPGPDIAYIMSTSGTTGRRKLVPWAHRVVLAGARVAANACALTAGDVGLHVVPIYLSHGVRSGLMFPLLAGSSVVVAPESDVDALFDALDRYRVSWFTAGPAVHKEILSRAPRFREIIARSRLRLVRSSSSSIDPEDIDRIEQTFGVPLLVVFSSSEASLVTHEPLPPRPRRRGSLGLPVLGEVAIMNEAGTFCAPGGTGEILVRGPLVFDGYLDDPALNAASFVDGWFRTGDLGRLDDNGYLFLTGRSKETINRGGDKISPEEIDFAIEGVAGVRAAATFGIPHPTLGEEIAAAVVTAGDIAIEEANILDHVRRQLGPERTPRRIYFIDKLPRTDTGKLRRAELPSLLGLDQPAAAAPIKPRPRDDAPALNPLEAALAGLWSTVLQLKNVGANEDFFLLGGDSLRGARLLTSVKAVFGVELTIRALFGEAATVAGMARAIEDVRAGNEDTGSTAYVRDE